MASIITQQHVLIHDTQLALEEVYEKLSDYNTLASDKTTLISKLSYANDTINVL
jgi:hypothetical protein